MHLLRHAPEVSALIQSHPQSEISNLMQRRLADLLADEDAMEDLVCFLIAESTDALADLEAAIGSMIRTPDGHPLWEVIEAHATCFEMVFVLSSSGYGALVYVPYLDARPDLLALCRSHATPVQEPSMP